MHSFCISKKFLLVWLLASVISLTSVVVFGFKVREELNDIEKLEFRVEEFAIGGYQVPLLEVINQLPNKDVWNSFVAQHDSIIVYIDPRSGRPDSLIYPYPFIPGDGERNNVTLGDLTVKLGYNVTEVNADVIKDLLLQFIRQHNSLIRINLNEIGDIRVDQVDDTLWDASIKRQVNGIPVRESRIAFTIKHGNIVMWGFDKWGDVNISTVPRISKEYAMDVAFRYIGGRLPNDSITVEPHLEIVPIEPKWDGTIGKGYGYALVWVFSFTREGYVNNWEVLVDAHSGRLMSFLDTNMYVKKKIVGSIYPLSDDGCCPDGCATASIPAPFMNTGFASPNNYTDFGGKYEYTSGTAVTTLDGLYVQMGTENCGTISESSSTGDIDLGGTNGQHDCTVPSGHSTGDTFSSRSCAIEVTNLNREVRSWVNTTWLDSYITCNVNIASTCNAYQSGNTINFYRSGGGCRNTGEIAAVFDHEWGHRWDSQDAAGSSSPNEAICDTIAGLRLRTSCTGRGFFWTLNRGCGQWTNCPSNPGTSYGYNCSGYNSTECCTQCTGVREIDYAKHSDPDADTITNFTCSICSTTGSYFGPCNREAHCEGVPPAQAAWDLAARDLQSSPFSLDKQTAFAIAEKIILQGHNNVTNWYTCTCPSTVNACGTSNAHPRWLAADDDDGNVNNGTPHASAIYNALNRHGIACSTLSQTNSGCAGGPTTAPTLSATAGDYSVSLSWTSVSGAANYYVWRSDGIGGCDWGKAKIATVSTTSYTDTQVLNGKEYYYQVQPVGSNTNCLGILSNCVTVTPNTPSCTPPTFGGVSSVTDVNACNAGIQVTWPTPTSWGQGATSGTFDVRRYTTSGCSGSYTTVATGLSATTTTYTDTTATAGTTYYYQVVAINNCTPPMSSTGTTSCSSGIVDNVGTAPSGLTNNTAADVNACTDSGVQITWSANPTNWGDNGYGTRTYSVLRDGSPIASNIAYGTTTYTDTTGTNGVTYTYTVRYTNGCSLSTTTSPGAQAADNVDTTPCPAVGNNLLVAKSGTNAVISWTAVSCSDLANYRVYGSTTYNAPFPSGWTVLGNPTTTSLNDPLTSSYIAYKAITVDACGNVSN